MLFRYALLFLLGAVKGEGTVGRCRDHRSVSGVS